MTTTPAELAAMTEALSSQFFEVWRPKWQSAIARYIQDHPERCQTPIDLPPYTDAAGDSDYDQMPCGTCPACRFNQAAKEAVGWSA